MPDYKKSKIYKIVNDVNDNFYIGSTIQSLHKRLNEHKSKHNKCMSKNLGVDMKECKIILVEAFECENRQELLKKEREYFDKYKLECKDTFINKVKPFLYQEEKDKYNKEYSTTNKRLEYIKKFNADNKDKLKEKNKQYRIKNKDKIKEMRDNNKKNTVVKNTCECGIKYHRLIKLKNTDTN
jgi:Uri superfamily endonuclease